LGKDAAIVFPKVEIYLGSGENADQPPQAGMTLMEGNGSSATEVALDGNGALSVAPGSDLFNKLISDEGLDLNVSRDVTLDKVHKLQLRVPKVLDNPDPADRVIISSITLLPIEVTWKTYGDNLAIDDNPNEGGGKRIFPGRKTPTDEDENRDKVKVKISGGLPNGTVYLKAFDVDDPTPATVDTTGEIDTNGTDGDDNHGEAKAGDIFGFSSKEGEFVISETPEAQVTLDANGEAELDFVITMQPGDNFRVVCAFDEDELDNVQVTDDSASGYLSPDDEHPSGFNGAASPMLTVWRHLWLEFDSMGPPEENQAVGGGTEHVNSQISYVDGLTHLSGNQSRIISLDSLRDEDDAFEKGIIRIETISETFEHSIIGNAGDEIIIDGQPPFSILGQEFEAWDDDVVQLGSTGTRSPRTMPYSLSGGDLIFTAYAQTYLLPKNVPSEYIDNDVQFDRNTDAINYYGDWRPVVVEHRDLDDTDDFWVVYLLAGWQPQTGDDNDPNEATSVVGQSDPGIIKENMGIIYVETLRESETLPPTPRINEEHTVVHEIGHQGGGSHSDLGIMEEGAPIDEKQFRPKTIKRFREEDTF